MRTAHTDQRGSVTFVLLALVALAFLMFSLWALSQAMNTCVDVVQAPGVSSETTGDAPFVETWSISLNPPLVHEMAVSPGQAEQFFALNQNEIHRFDGSGARLARFAAPPKSTRLVTDPTGAVPYLMVVSSNTKGTGAIDHVVTTDYYLQALDTSGREVWKKRFDPQDVSAPEPVVATLNQCPVVILSAGRKILGFDASGAELWDVPLWHHPGTVTEADLSGDGSGGLLAALAPKREIVWISADGTPIGPWGKGDGPSRFRAIKTNTGISGVSLRQVFGRGPGDRHALVFFDSGGATIREIELPPDAPRLSYSPIAAMDLNGSGQRNWVIALGDGTLMVFSPVGEEIARHTTGVRLRALLPLPQQNGADLLITATDRGLVAWRPVPGRIHRPG